VFVERGRRATVLVTRDRARLGEHCAPLGELPRFENSRNVEMRPERYHSALSEAPGISHDLRGSWPLAWVELCL
jgi:hypothetical protein